MERLVVAGIDLTEFLKIPYVGRRHPGSVSVEEFLADPKAGSNCQLLALGVLKKAGFHIGDVKMDQNERVGSKELWDDGLFTKKLFDVSEFGGFLASMGEALALAEAAQPFNIFFFWPPEANPCHRSVSPDFKRLHIGICVRGIDIKDMASGKGELPEPLILHNFYPGPSGLWTFDDFEAREYSLYGAKQPTIRLAP